jgi:hypothetical protein
LKKELGVEPAVRLMSTNSFCAAIETVSGWMKSMQTMYFWLPTNKNGI